MRVNHYEVLGIAMSASPAEIRAAYRSLVFKYHPDRSNDPQATQIFIRVAEAYEVLKDSERRISYDRLLRGEPVPKRSPSQSSPPRRPQATSPPTARPAPPASVPDMLRLATLLNRGRYNDAERLAQQLIDRDPKQAIPYAVLADIAAIRGHLRKAAEMYALAAQMNPLEPTYLRKHEQVLRTLQNPARIATARIEETSSLTAPIVGSAIIVSCAVYVAVSKEPPLFPTFGPIATWTLGLAVMLFLSGVTLGAALAIGGLLDRFIAVRATAVMRVPPSVTLGIIATVNFWAACALYVLVGVSQDAFNASTSRLMAGVVVVTVLMWGASCYSASIFPIQTLGWGGNLTYIGGLAGWMAADGLRE